MRNLAIITARSGSKGLPGKNIKLLNGKPLMAYSIEAALKSGEFNTVMVSTDSGEYGKIAEKYGAEVPFLRSERTSSDSASSWDAVEEVLKYYEGMGQSFDTFCLLQPTSPLRDDNDIVEAYKIYRNKNAIAVLSFTELDHPLEWCGQIDNSLSIDGFLKRENDLQRQRMTKSYRPNGAIYIVSVQEFRKDRFLYRSGAYAYIMPQEKSVDIDTDFDLRLVEFIMSQTS